MEWNWTNLNINLSGGDWMCVPINSQPYFGSYRRCRPLPEAIRMALTAKLFDVKT